MWSPPKCHILLTFFVVTMIIVKLNAKAVDKSVKIANEAATEKTIFKRGHSSGGSIGNEYGPPIHITSSVLELSKVPSSSHAEIATDGADAFTHYAATLEQPWKPSSLGSSYELWLSSDSGLQHYPSTHDVGDSVFSSDKHYVAAGGGLSSGLHTQVISSHDENAHDFSDNIDFNNVADFKGDKHYVTSYGRRR